MDALFVAGIDHRSAALDVRERLALTPAESEGALQHLAAGVVTEAMVLVTCNRVEVYGVAADPGDAAVRAFQVLAAVRDVRWNELGGALRVETGSDAVRRAFRVAASLDSMVVGEAQILGQVKAAFALAQRCGTVAAGLHELLAHAFVVAKKVRTGTEIGRHAVSVASVAVELAQKIFGDLRGRTALLVGAGDTGELAARHLAGQGAVLTVANRTPDRAAALAQALGGRVVAFGRWAEALAASDIVLTSTGAPGHVLTRDVVAASLGRRRGRPLFFVDIAVPRDVDPRVDELDGVYVYDLDDLRRVTEANRRERDRAAHEAETLVGREVARFVARARARQAAPVIASLREKAERIRREELARAQARLRGAPPETLAVLEALSSGLVNKILHAPTTRLRAAFEAGDGEASVRTVTELFALGRPGPLTGPSGS
jgi:glutamyl-tRNA reductase